MESCEKCMSQGVECVRSQPSSKSEHVHFMPAPETNAATFSTFSPLQPSTRGPHADSSAQQGLHEPGSADGTTGTAAGLERLGEIPIGTELDALVDLYFSSVHHFGFFAFINQFQFQRLLVKGKTPRELTLIMIANAMRFAAPPTPENLARADAWADAAIGSAVPRIYKGFDAVQLMVLLLSQHYDLNRCHFASAWLLGANCTRMMQMMSLQTFDRTYSTAFASNTRLPPLISAECLRRLAWSAFYADSIVDGGRAGFHTIDVDAYRLQLPCNHTSFLANESVRTEPLRPDRTDDGSGVSHAGHLDMSAYLLRTAAARRRGLHFAFRASHKEQTVEAALTELHTLELDIAAIVADLFKRYQYNADNLILHRDRLVQFLLLHMLRHNLFIVIGRAALQIYPRDPEKQNLIRDVRRKRISHALPIAHLVAEGLRAGISFDPQIGVQAYVALEILLFEPRRVNDGESPIYTATTDHTEAIVHLLAVVRELASRSDMVKQLHIEAVHRLLRFELANLLDASDIAAFRSEYRLVGLDDEEYDFRDFRWAKLERLRRSAGSSADAVQNEALLEYNERTLSGAPSRTQSPRLDAMDVNDAFSYASTSAAPMDAGTQYDLNALDAPAMEGEVVGATAQPMFGSGMESMGLEQTSWFDWPWLLDESGQSTFQTGDPDVFWNQI